MKAIFITAAILMLVGAGCEPERHQEGWIVCTIGAYATCERTQGFRPNPNGEGCVDVNDTTFCGSYTIQPNVITTL